MRDKASGLLSSFMHKPSMHKDVFKAIKPIYEELSSDDLLSRCLGGYTQNTNESFNSVVWSIAPKAVSSGKTVLDIATDIAIITFNDGLSSLFPVYDALGLTVGRNLCLECLRFLFGIRRKPHQSRRALTFRYRKRGSTQHYIDQKRAGGAKYGRGRAIVWCWDSRVKVTKFLWTILLRFRKVTAFSNFKRVFLETMFSKSASSRTRRVFIRST